jgi:hypothetical protein
MMMHHPRALSRPSGTSARRASAVATRSTSSRPAAIPRGHVTARAASPADREAQRQHPQIDAAAPSRRSALLLAATSLLLATPLPPAHANPLEDATRAYLRPTDALTDEQAVAALMDARSTLKDLAQLAATPMESRERFEGRKLWPAYARWLRPAGPAAPRVVALALGGKDVESTLSARYGGAAAAGGGGGGEAAAAATAAASSSKQQQPLGDELYRSLGAVLTISGRTIREEAQASPNRALRAAAAIEGVLERVPKDVKDGAQALRVAERQKRGKA